MESRKLNACHVLSMDRDAWLSCFTFLCTLAWYSLWTLSLDNLSFTLFGDTVAWHSCGTLLLDTLSGLQSCYRFVASMHIRVWLVSAWPLTQCRIVGQSLHASVTLCYKAWRNGLLSSTLYYKAYETVLPSTHLYCLETLQKKVPFSVLPGTTQLTKPTSQYDFVLQACRNVLPSTS